MKKNRTKHSPVFKAKVALAVLREQAVAELSRRHKVHANQTYKWKRQLLENVTRAFETEEVGGGDASMREAELLQKIGELTMERDFLSHEARSIAMTPRRELVEPNAPLSMRWQCELLGVNWSSLYYEPVAPDGEQLALIASDGRATSEASIFRQPHDDTDTQSGGVGRQPQARAASYAVDGAPAACSYDTSSW